MKRAFILPTLVLLSLICLPVLSFAETTPEDALEHFNYYSNGLPCREDGTLFSDDWVVDDTGVSKARFVFVAFDGRVEKRIINYPEDIESDGEPFPAGTLNVSLSSVKEKGEDVVVVIGNEHASYSVNLFAEENYTCSKVMLPGEYTVESVSVIGDASNSYETADASQKITVKNGEASDCRIQFKKSSKNKVVKQGELVNQGSKSRGKALLQALVIPIVTILFAVGIILWKKYRG